MPTATTTPPPPTGYRSNYPRSRTKSPLCPGTDRRTFWGAPDSKTCCLAWTICRQLPARNDSDTLGDYDGDEPRPDFQSDFTISAPSIIRATRTTSHLPTHPPLQLACTTFPDPPVGMVILKLTYHPTQGPRDRPRLSPKYQRNGVPISSFLVPIPMISSFLVPTHGPGLIHSKLNKSYSRPNLDSTAPRG